MNEEAPPPLDEDEDNCPESPAKPEVEFPEEALVSSDALTGAIVATPPDPELPIWL